MGTARLIDMNDFDDLDELERRMRHKLLEDGPAHRGTSFTTEERGWASALLGTDETRRLERRRDNTRPFKHKKPIVTAEYYLVPPSELNALSGGWTITVRVNGKEHRSTWGLSEEDCLRVIAGLSAKGVQIRKIETEYMKEIAKYRAEAKAKKPESSRKAILQRLRGFRK